MPATLDAPDAAIAGHVYELVVPQIERPAFEVRVVNMGRISLRNQSNLSGTLVLRPVAAILPVIRPVKGESTWLAEDEEE